MIMRGGDRHAPSWTRSRPANEVAGIAAERRYEVSLVGDVRAEVRRVHPLAKITAVPRCTILWSRPGRPEEVDVLLTGLLDMGITPREVYQSPVPEAGAGVFYCEVRIGGCLGDASLRHLGWSHRVVQTTVFELTVTHELLCALLLQLSAVTKVDYVRGLQHS